MDLTIYTHTVKAPNGDMFTRLTDALDYNGWYTEERGYQVVATEQTILHLQVGSPVLVHAFGRLRPGTVTKLGRTKVTVEYQRNAAGTMASRIFGALELAPAPGTAFTREDVTR